MTLRVILPERSKDMLSNGLRGLTRRLSELGLADATGYGIGGEFGYGADFENAIFMLHRFCWCERDDCRWCAGCDCKPNEPIQYFVDGEHVTADQQWAWSQNFLEKSHQVWIHRVAERNRRWRTVFPAVTHHCNPSGLMLDLPERETNATRNGAAPNFWHKPTGFKVWWYKWIGRDMEVWNPTSVKPRQVLSDCRASLTHKAPQDAPVQVP